jgi:hypothetical protein
MATTYEPIATTTLGSDAASYTFSTISGSYTDLVLISSVRSTRAAADDSVYIRINSDTGSNYSNTVVKGNGSSASSNRNSNTTALYLADNIDAANQAAGTFSPMITNFENYSNATTYKTVLSRHNQAAGEVAAVVGLWRSTSAITSIQIYCAIGNLKSGSTFTLYGIKAA